MLCTQLARRTGRVPGHSQPTACNHPRPHVTRQQHVSIRYLKGPAHLLPTMLLLVATTMVQRLQAMPPPGPSSA